MTFSKEKQSIHNMRLAKEIESRQAETKANAEKRKAVVVANGSCLTCTHTKSQCGIFLICSLKSKKVREYNYCEHYTSPESKGKENG
jgi:uncharacterized protein YdaU (DUF1376 family)